MVLALGFEPFVQQSVRYPLRNQVVPSASPPLIPTIQNLTFSENSNGENMTIAFESVIMQALYADSVDPLQSTCQLPTCDWPLYESAAFCSLCEDALDDVTIEPDADEVLQTHAEDYYFNIWQSTNLDLGTSGGRPSMSIFRNTTSNISLGQGVSYTFQVNASATFETSSGYRNLALSYPGSMAWDLYDQLGYPVSFLGGARWSSDTVINGVAAPLKAFGYVNLTYSESLRRLVATSAKRCVISLCAQQYSSAYQNGSLLTNMTVRDWGTIRMRDSPSMRGFWWNATINSTPFQCTHDSGGVSVGNDYFGIAHFVVPALRKLEGNTTNYNQTHREADAVNAPNHVMRFMSDIEGSCDKIAQGLSNYVQQHGEGHAEGNGYTATPFVEVRWVWLTYPIMLMMIVLVITVITIIQTKRRSLPTWKSSPFPLLFNYHDSDICAKQLMLASQPTSRPQSQPEAQPAPNGDAAPAPAPAPASTPAPAPLLASNRSSPRTPSPDMTQAFQHQRTVAATKTSAHEQLAAKTTLRLRRLGGGTSWGFEKVEPSERNGQAVAV